MASSDSDDDQRDDHDPDDDRRRQGVEHPDVDDVLQVRRDEGQREVAEDDRRDAGEQLEDRLEHLAQPLARVLGEEDRRREPHGQAEQAGEEGDLDGVGDERQHAVAGVAEADGPLGAAEELARARRRRRTRSCPRAGRPRSRRSSGPRSRRRRGACRRRRAPSSASGPAAGRRQARERRPVSWRSRQPHYRSRRGQPTTPCTLTIRRSSRRSPRPPRTSRARSRTYPTSSTSAVRRSSR